eukprot:Gb_06120 [translate_table: standard]
MASVTIIPTSSSIRLLDTEPISSNPSSTTLRAIISFSSAIRPTFLRIINYGKRQLHHHRSMLLPLNSRQDFCMWAAANIALEAAEYPISREKSAQDSDRKDELEPFSEHFSILEELGLANKEVKLLMRKHPFLSNQSPTSMSKTIQALESLGIKGDRLILFIKKRPSVFTVDLESTTDFIRENLEEFNVEKFHRILFKADPRVVLSFPDKINLLLKHGVKKSQLNNLLNKLNLKVFCERSVEDLNDVLIFLKDFDEEKEFCGIILRHPALLLLNVGRDLKPRVEFFENLLKGEDVLKKLLRLFPGILAYTVEHMEKHVEYLKSSVFSEANVAIIVMAYPQILSLSIERKLQPKIEFLQKCGLNEKEIAKLLIRCPAFLGLSFDENLSRKAILLGNIGFEPYSYHLAQVLSTVSRISYEKLQTTIDLFLSYGLSYEDICEMGTKQPHILRYSHECLKPKIDYLVNEMHSSSKDLISCPAFLGYSLEDRIKPRHEIMEWLMSKGLIKRYSLNRILAISDKDFMEMAIEKGFIRELNLKMTVGSIKSSNSSNGNFRSRKHEKEDL